MSFVAIGTLRAKLVSGKVRIIGESLSLEFQEITIAI